MSEQLIGAVNRLHRRAETTVMSIKRIWTRTRHKALLSVALCAPPWLCVPGENH